MNSVLLTCWLRSVLLTVRVLLTDKSFDWWRNSVFLSRRNHTNHKKDPRGNIEESPRFQRLRERRSNYEATQTRSSDTSGGGSSNRISSSQDLNLDLAIENFPALPSPNSPNESFKTASSLKVSCSIYW